MKLQTWEILISKQAYKWYQQKKSIKEKYHKLKFLNTAHANMEILLHAMEVVEDQLQGIRDNFVHGDMQCLSLGGLLGATYRCLFWSHNLYFASIFLPCFYTSSIFS